MQDKFEAKKLVLLRHGESEWNRENRFTGWTDVELSMNGHHEAIESGRRLRCEGVCVDVAFTSVLKRAIKTLWLALEELEQVWVPVHRSWRLNERHYGALQGRNKSETADEVGADQVHQWRRSFDVRPPALTPDDERYPGRDRRYTALKVDQIPLAESLKDTIERVLPYWKDTISPAFDSAQTVLIVAHGNTLRALIKYLDQISDERIAELNIPTGVPITYKLDAALRPTSRSHILK